MPMVRVKKLRVPNVGVGVKSSKKTQIRSTTRYRSHSSNIKSTIRATKRVVNKIRSWFGSDTKKKKKSGTSKKVGKTTTAPKNQKQNSSTPEFFKSIYADDPKFKKKYHTDSYRDLGRTALSKKHLGFKRRRELLHHARNHKSALAHVRETLSVVSRVVRESYEKKV